MKKTILFLGMVLILLLMGCTEDVRKYARASGETAVKSLDDSQKLILAQTDSTQYLSAIIVDDYVLVFDPKDHDKVWKVKEMDILGTITLTLFIILLVGLFVAGIAKLLND